MMTREAAIDVAGHAIYTAKPLDPAADGVTCRKRGAELVAALERLGLLKFDDATTTYPPTADRVLANITLGPRGIGRGERVVSARVPDSRDAEAFIEDLKRMGIVLRLIGAGVDVVPVRERVRQALVNLAERRST